MQAILSLRLLFQAGLIRSALLICPKPLVSNWCRELRSWAADLPFEVIGGDTSARRASWQVSNCPLKLVNYELVTRDAAWLDDDAVRFDVVVLDEAQRIKNGDAKTAQAVRSIRRSRSWALTGTPIENRPEDLVNLFAFVDPHRIPPDTSMKRLAHLTHDCILRRTKEDVLADLPPKTIHDAYVELTPAQREAYNLAAREGVVRLNVQSTTYVFLCDRWWNPAVEDQAINRAHRIGQREPVFVTRFVTPDTIEGRIAEVLERKRQLFNELIEQNGSPPRLGLTEEEIFGLFNIANRPKRATA